MFEMIFSNGCDTRASTSAGDAPGYRRKTSAIGTSICGSSSRGISIVLYPPISKKAIINRIVNFDWINAFAIFPDKPSFIIKSLFGIHLFYCNRYSVVEFTFTGQYEFLITTQTRQDFHVVTLSFA